MERSPGQRATADLVHFKRQLNHYRARLDENDPGHIATIEAHLANAEAALRDHRYRRVGPRLKPARNLIQYIVCEPVEPKPKNQLLWRQRLLRLRSRCFRSHARVKLALPAVAVLVCLVVPCVHHALVLQHARDDVTNALAGDGYASQDEVLTAAGLPARYRFYTGRPAVIQDLPPGQMAWVGTDNIDGVAGRYGITPDNGGIGTDGSDSAAGVTINNTDEYGDSETVLVVNTGRGFIGVAFIGGCEPDNGTLDEPSDGYPFERGDTPIQMTAITISCPNGGD